MREVVAKTVFETFGEEGFHEVLSHWSPTARHTYLRMMGVK